MEKNINRERFISIKIEDINLFGDLKSDTVYRYLKLNNIDNLDQLLHLIENDSFNYLDAKSKSIERIIGIFDLILYKYFQIPLKADIPYEKTIKVNDKTQLIKDQLKEILYLNRMGFDRNEITKIYKLIGNSEYELTFIEILYLLRKQVQEELNDYLPSNMQKLNLSFYNKLDLIIENYEKFVKVPEDKTESYDPEIDYLASRIKELEFKKQEIETEIMQLESELMKKMIKKTRGDTYER